MFASSWRRVQWPRAAAQSEQEHETLRQVICPGADRRPLTHREQNAIAYELDTRAHKTFEFIPLALTATSHRPVETVGSTPRNWSATLA